MFYILGHIVFIKSLLTSEIGLSVIENFSRNLGIPCGFILLINAYYTDKRRLWALYGKLWVLFVIILTFILAIIKARRGLMFMSLNILLFSYIMYYYANRGNLFKRYFPLIIIFFYFYMEPMYMMKKSRRLKLNYRAL